LERGKGRRGEGSRIKEEIDEGLGAEEGAGKGVVVLRSPEVEFTILAEDVHGAPALRRVLEGARSRVLAVDKRGENAVQMSGRMRTPRLPKAT